MLKIKITITSPYFKYSTYILLHLQSMLPPPVMLMIQHFSLHGYVWFIQPETVAFQFISGLGSSRHLCCIADVCPKLPLGTNQSILQFIHIVILV